MNQLFSCQSCHPFVLLYLLSQVAQASLRLQQYLGEILPFGGYAETCYWTGYGFWPQVNNFTRAYPKQAQKLS